MIITDIKGYSIRLPLDCGHFCWVIKENWPQSGIEGERQDCPQIEKCPQLRRHENLLCKKKKKNH